jgi:hypothetical protein
LPSHEANPVSHAAPHFPCEHVVLPFDVAGQVVSHEPQWLRLLFVSTHAPVHAVCPEAHVAAHAPFVQTCPGAHALPHAPQFEGSLATVASQPSLGSPLQSAWPGSQLDVCGKHMPPSQEEGLAPGVVPDVEEHAAPTISKRERRCFE